MSTKIKILIAFLLGVIVAAAVPIVILATGSFDWSAAGKPSALETELAEWALGRSMATHAPKSVNRITHAGDIEAGVDHFRENCVMCHGAKGVARSEAGAGLNPPAPALEDPTVQALTDGQLFWVVKNGIRMTGMPAFGPTHDENEIWQIVAFVRQLPMLTDAQKSQLKGHGDGEEHHHH